MRDGVTDTDVPQTQHSRQVPLINSLHIGVDVRCSGTLISAQTSWNDMVTDQ